MTLRNRKIVVGCRNIAFPMLFFAYQFIVRLLPNLTADVIMQKTAVGASAFGAITGAYYFGMAISNIPAALLLERYATGRIVGIASAVCGSLLFVFYNVTDWYTALFVRFLLGVAASVGFVAVSKTALQYFPNNAYSFVISCAFTGGLFVSFLGSGPLCFLMETYGTLRIINALAFLGLLIAVGAWMLSCSKKNKTNGFAWKPKIKTVILSKKMMLLGFSNMLVMGFGKAFLDLWGVSYFVVANAVSKTEAATIVGCSFFGLMIGGPILSSCATLIGYTRVIVICILLETSIFYWVVLSIDSFGSAFLMCVMFILGILYSSRIVFLSLCTKLFDSRSLITVAVACLSSLVMCSGMFFSNVIGISLTYLSPVASQLGYSAEALRTSLLVIPVASLIGLSLVIALRMLTTEEK